MDTDVPLSLFALPCLAAAAVGGEFFAFPGCMVWLAPGLLMAIGSGLCGYVLGVKRNERAHREELVKAAIGSAVGMGIAGCLLAYSALLIMTGSPGPYPAPQVIAAMLLGFGVAILSALIGQSIGGRAREQRASDRWFTAGLFASNLFTLWLVNRKWANGSGGADASAEPEFEIELASGEEIEAEEREYIGNILELGGTTAREVMTPRTDVIALDVAWEPWKILAEVAGSRFSRFPVYEERIDNVIGALHLRDLLEFLARGDQINNLVLSELVREAYFVPGGLKADDVLRDLQRQKSHMAIVLDEFGGMAGILTIEDLLEEIVGEIQDEHDDESKLVHEREDGSWVIDAQLPLDDFAELAGVELDDEDGDVDTLGGFVATKFGRIPDGRESFVHAGLDFTVLSVEKNRILRVGVRRVNSADSV